MTDEENAFLRAIRDNPDDRVVRLVYADWLDERGDPRGEYLRLSCRLAEVRDGIDQKWLEAVRATELRLNQIRLNSGREVSLRAYRQFRVYEGLLEGMPTREMNADIIDRLVAEERARPFTGPPLLLTPEQRPLKHPRRHPYPFGEPAALPSVACVGRFHSSSPTREAMRDFSDLVVIWFQDEFSPPIGPEVWNQFHEIDWDRHARDGDY